MGSTTQPSPTVPPFDRGLGTYPLVQPGHGHLELNLTLFLLFTPPLPNAVLHKLQLPRRPMDQSKFSQLLETKSSLFSALTIHSMSFKPLPYRCQSFPLMPCWVGVQHTLNAQTIFVERMLGTDMPMHLIFRGKASKTHQADMWTRFVGLVRAGTFESHLWRTRQEDIRPSLVFFAHSPCLMPRGKRIMRPSVKHFLCQCITRSFTEVKNFYIRSGAHE